MQAACPSQQGQRQQQMCATCPCSRLARLYVIRLGARTLRMLMTESWELQDEEDRDRDTNLCVICLEHDTDSVFATCGHMCGSHLWSSEGQLLGTKQKDLTASVFSSAGVFAGIARKDVTSARSAVPKHTPSRFSGLDATTMQRGNSFYFERC